MLLKEKKAFVTGASRGIGRAIAIKFMQEGADVYALSTKTPGDIEELNKIASDCGVKLVWKEADISSESRMEEVIAEILAESGGVDVLVNNAGVTKDGLIFRMELNDWKSVVDINLTGAFLTCRAIARDMIRKKTGSIINMSSVVGVHGNAGQCNYSASKAGLIGLTKSLAQECASRGVRVNAIAPGFIETDMTNSLSETVKTAINSKIPMKRFGSSDDIASAVLFLASDMSQYITGNVLAVDGGMGM